MKHIKYLLAALIASFMVSYLFGAFYDGSFVLLQETRVHVIAGTSTLMAIASGLYAVKQIEV